MATTTMGAPAGSSSGNTLSSLSTLSKARKKGLEFNEVKVCRGYQNKMGTIDTNTANVGGSIMINQIKKNHTVNMMSMKKRVDNDLPWSYKYSKNFNVARVSPPKKIKSLAPLKEIRSSPTNKQPHSAREYTSKGSKLDLNKDHKIDPTQDIEDPEDQEIYEKFLDMLRRRKTIELARRIASSVFLEAEEQMLLNAYSGVPQYVEGFISTTCSSDPSKEEEVDENFGEVEEASFNSESHEEVQNGNIHSHTPIEENSKDE
ncbi:hypothetical protein C9374_008770 [Naegleria lovaniensis]|uniref:Uncharacterized protein n=1 Tax=Naegleria lovaniensis TaxID=51637 RepID=A0AA88KHT0_NAELO|nr:uncharacterized protein C9374_008770 [Naegleria lovaniensis]KAG2378148.1 hypothetical protein C9374_008770 [Naegleria lovaniensis]